MKSKNKVINSNDIFSFFQELTIKSNYETYFGKSNTINESYYYGLNAFYDIPTLNKNLLRIYRSKKKSLLIMNLIDDSLRVFNNCFYQQ